MKYVYRYDQEKENYGWYVVIELYATRRYFADSAYGSKEESFLAALAFRNQELKKHNLPLSERVVSTRKRVTNTSGRPGVCKSGSYYYAYFPIEENEVLTRKYSTKKYGEQGAFERAKSWREKLEIAVYGMVSFQHVS
jgi:hypothetical protein